MSEQTASAERAITVAGVTIIVEGVDYHRNGIGGNGFYVVVFRWAEVDDEPRAMLGIVFPGECRVAVLDRHQARRGNIFMHGNGDHEGGNAWRGDHFQPVLTAAITAVMGYNPFECDLP